MTYLGVNPYQNLSRFTALKPLSSYPQETIKNIKLLSFSKNKMASPFGSYIYRLQRFPGDVDLIEEFNECCSLKEVISQFERTLKRVVRQILKSRYHYYSEVKAGLDIRYDINIGTMTNGIYIPNPELSLITYTYYEMDLLTLEENNIIQYILSNVKDFGSREYDTITFIYREHKILRWTAEEILKGSKNLPGSKKISLKQALHHQTYLKIDMIVALSSKLIEVTNFFQLAYEDKHGDIHLINVDFSINQNIPIQLPKEIEKLYFSDMFYSPFKMVKRLYSLARHNNDKILLHKIIPFVSANASLLYQIKSEIDTILLVLERMKSFPKKLIENELDEEKLRISTILELSREELLQINDLINKINKTKRKHDKMSLLKNLKKLIVAHINALTINYLEKVGLNPPPNQYLPPYHTYDYSIVRGSAQIPENPFNYYKNIVDELEKDIILEPPGLHGESDILEIPLKTESFSKKRPLDDTNEPQEVKAIKEEYRKVFEEEEAAFLREQEEAFLKEKTIEQKFKDLEDLEMIRKKKNKTKKLLHSQEQVLQEQQRLFELEEQLIHELEEERHLFAKGYGGYNVFYPLESHHYPNFFDPPESSEILSQKIVSNPGLNEIPKIDQLRREMIDEELDERLKAQLMGGSLIGEGKIGGYAYSHNFRIPLYMNENLVLPKLLQNEMRFHPQTASSYASDYHHRGYGPSLKPPHIINAPLVWYGEILPGVQRAGCHDCSPVIEQINKRE